ncbi:MAG: hypothetical protein H0Z33_09575 [Bacillaceae bacterium]|nr:hypothetical protein [Bacillaceae bacterium]
MKKTTLYLAIAVVLAILAGNFIYFQSQQLSSPIMLKHYYDLPLDPEVRFELHYLVNRDEEMDISWISIPGLDYVQTINDYQGSGQSFRHHKLKSVMVVINGDLLKQNNGNQDQWIFTEVTAHLTNGNTKTFPVGKVVITEFKESPLKFKATGSSTDGTGFRVLEAEEELDIQQVEIPFSEQLLPDLKVLIDQQPYTEDLLPIKLKKGDLIEVNHQFSFDETNSSRLHYYDSHIYLMGRTAGGEAFKRGANIHFRPYLSQKDVNQLVEQAR